jgi:hydrophobic/amphiphilic exporter-1 (mainly G- bacteria), HAE1 family
MMGLIRTSVARPVGLCVITLAVVVFGVVALRQLAVDFLPAVDVPRISVITRYPGVAPAEIETLITRPIEQATSTVQGVQQLDAVSSEGLSRVRLRFAWGVPLDQALDDVREALDKVRAVLPEQAEPPAIHKFDLSEVPVAFLGLTGSGDQRKLKYLAQDELTRALERVPGVASVDVTGGLDREIRVALDGSRLSAFGVTASQVEQALARENRTVSAGEMRASGREVVIRTAGEFENLEQIEDAVVATRGQTPVRVRDLGKVIDTIRKRRNQLWIDGEPGIRLQVQKQSGANTVEVVTAVEQELVRINQDYAGRAELSMLWSAADFIQASVRNVQVSAGFGALLAVLVLLVFLRSWRATLAIAVAIPVSVVAAFGLMYFRGMTLNVISFGGLALGVGMLVDGAIVILESIHGKRQQGLAAIDAAIEGAREVAGPVLAGTITTIAVFAPVVFVGGFAGVFFGQMALVVTFSLLCSLVVALTLLPMLSARLLGGGDAGARQNRLLRWLDARVAAAFRRLERAYGRALEAALAAPAAIFVAAAVLLGCSLAFVPNIGVELMPESDEGQIEVEVELPVGTPLEVTSGVMQDVERRIRESLNPGELLHTMSSAGPPAWWRPGASNEGEIDMIFVPVSERKRGIGEIEAGIRRALQGIPGAKLQVRQESINILSRIVRRGTDRVTVEIRGHDLVTADALSEQVVRAIAPIPGVAHARPDREMRQLERVLHVDRARAAELGIGSSQIADAVETYVLGRVTTRYRDQGDEFDIRVQLDEAERHDLDQLPSLPIVTPAGNRVALGSLVRIEEALGPSSITRLDQERVLRVNVGAAGRPLDQLASEIREQIAEISVPDGFEIKLAGELTEQRQTFGELLIGILLALFLVYAAMAVQFESARHPLVVMLSVPFAGIGVIAALVATRTTFNMNSFLGMIVLIGIVVNNAIVLVHYTNLLRREQRMSLRQSVITAGIRRLRPILMTTLTTSLGLLPLAFGLGEGSELQAPLARVVVGGLLSSSLVTLLLVPCAYYVMERRREPRAQPALVLDTSDARAAE